MSDIPTTEKVRADYVRDRLRGIDFYQVGRSRTSEEARYGGQFDAWLAQTVATAKAEAIREFRVWLIDDQIEQYGIVLPDIHSVVDDLDECADGIEQEARR